MILFHYSSMRELLQHAYPEFQWEESRFRRPKVQTPNKYWEDVSRQRDLLDSIGKDMNLKQVSSLLATPQELIPDLHKLSDWYSVSRKDVEGKGGKVLFKLHGSLHKALRAAYPEYPWRSDRFAIRERPPKDHLNSNSQLMAALDKAEKQLGIQQVPPPPKISGQGGIPSLLHHFQVPRKRTSKTHRRKGQLHILRGCEISTIIMS